MKVSRTVLAVIAVVIIVVVGVLAFSFLTPPPSSAKTFKYLDVAPAQQNAQLKQGLVDAAISWEPYVSDSVYDGTANVLVRSHDIWPNHPCCVIAADNAWAQANPELAQRVVKAHTVATQWIQDAIAHPDSNNYTLLLQIGAAFSNRSTAVVNVSIGNMGLNYNITTETKDYFAQFTEEYIELGVVKNNSLSSKGYSTVDQFLNTYVDLSYLNASADIQPVDPSATLQTVYIGYLAGDLHQFARIVAENKSLPGFDGRSIFETYGIQTATPVGMPAAGYPNGGAVMSSFASKADSKINMGYLGCAPALFSYLNTAAIDTRIVSLANTEGSALIAPGNTTIDDLSGKTIAEPGTSSIQFLMLHAIAEQYGYNVTKA